MNEIKQLESKIENLKKSPYETVCLAQGKEMDRLEYISLLNELLMEAKARKRS
jgi:hypothetical protein